MGESADVNLWRVNPPWWDQKKDGSKKLKYALWAMRFVETKDDGTEVDHPADAEPRGVRHLRVGRFGNIEQTATWNRLYGEPSPPPGNGWTEYKWCIGYRLWRRKVQPI